MNYAKDLNLEQLEWFWKQKLRRERGEETSMPGSWAHEYQQQEQRRKNACKFIEDSFVVAPACHDVLIWEV